MTDPVRKLIRLLSLARIGLSEAFLLATSAVLSGATVAALHLWADVPAPTAILAVLGCLSVIVAGHSLMRRASAASSIDAEIAELRAEIAVLRRSTSVGSREAAPVAVDRAPEPAWRGAPGRASSASFAPGAGMRPTALLPAPSFATAPSRSFAHNVPPVTERPATAASPVSSSPGQEPARSSERTGSAGSHRAPGSGAERREERRQPVSGLRVRAAPAASSETVIPHNPPEPASARQPNIRREVSAYPDAAANDAAGLLDLDAMQALIEQCAGEHPTTAANAVKPFGVASAALDPRRPGSSAAPGATEEVTLFGHIALIAEALEAKRMEVSLDPLIGLGDRKVRNLELSMRLVTQAGHAYGEEEFHRIAAGTGLVARIDAAKLASAAGVLSRFRTNGSRAALFLAIAGETLVDDTFSRAFDELLGSGREENRSLVLAFAQAEARNFTAAHWSTIGQTAKAGVRFALAEVTDLDTDFERLKSHGFDYIKLDAAVFLDGLPTPGGHIPAADICRHLAGLGLDLVLGGTAAG
jgi:cyclic-di-GMP phosphodiesterase TipF (flagellum assembly factor)